MLASVSCVLKEAMLSQLEPVVARILQALQSEEGVTVSDANDLSMGLWVSIQLCVVCRFTMPRRRCLFLTLMMKRRKRR